jgi:hypothetical protein
VVQVAPRHLDREPDPGRAQVLDGALHRAALLLGDRRDPTPAATGRHESRDVADGG